MLSFFYRFAQLSRLYKYLPRLIDDKFTGGSRQYRLLTSVEYLHSEFLLQLLYHRTKCGLCYVTVVCSLDKMLVSVYCNDVFQLL